MPFKIKNWKLALLAFLGVCFLSSLGLWQLSRAEQKKVLLASYDQRTQQTPLMSQQLDATADQRFYRTQLEGYFDNEHTFLLDNKTWHGKVGYEIYTLFYAKGLSTPLLVNRGFIPLGKSRDQLPPIKAITGNVTIIGMLNLPPTYVALGQIKESAKLTWPLRVQYIKPSDFALFLGHSIFPYIVIIDPSDNAAYTVEWQIVAMPPEKHLGYAVQWFALALTLLILFVVLNREPSNSRRKKLKP